MIQPFPCALTIGMFDGVHLGHRAVLSRLSEEAAARGGIQACVITFASHPLSEIKGTGPLLLMTPLEKRAALKRAGMRKIIILKPDKRILDMTPVRFLSALARRYGIKPVCIVTGYDFRFGKDRAGGMPDIRNYFGLGERDCIALKPHLNKGEIMSSTVIREHVARGQITRANQMLGEPYSICAGVEPGRGIASTLGFPTANLAINHHKLYPAAGVYAVAVSAGSRGRMHPGVCNIMNEAGGLKVEVHIIKYKPRRPLYGSRLHVSFIDRIRGIETFASQKALSERISRDAAQAVAAYRCVKCLRCLF